MQAFQRKIPIYSAYPYNKNQNGGYKPQKKKSEKYNGSGCLDMTAFMALKNIERERAKKSGHERKPKKKKQRRL